MHLNNFVVFTVVSLIFCVVENAQSNAFDFDQIFTTDALKSSRAESFASSVSASITVFGFAPEGNAITDPKLTGSGSGNSAFPDYRGWKNVSLVSYADQNPDRMFSSIYTTAADALSESAWETSNNIVANSERDGPPDRILRSAKFVSDSDNYSGSISLELTTAPELGNGIDNVPIWKRFLQSFFGQVGTMSPSSPAPVPEPATMLLFGTGLAGLAGMVIRRKKK